MAVTHEKKVKIARSLSVASGLYDLNPENMASNVGTSIVSLVRLFLGYDIGDKVQSKRGSGYLNLIKCVVEFIESNVTDRGDGLSARERLCIRVYGMEDVYELCDTSP